MVEEPQNQLQEHSSATTAMPTQKCPLKARFSNMSTTMFLQSLHSTGLGILEEIEQHISTSNQCDHSPLKDLVLYGTTPLILACWYGDLNRVKHIIENWGADFQAAGIYYDWSVRYGGSSRIIERATPLFVAAYNGHLDIVKYLVGLGADSSSKTSSETDRDLDGLTPLHGAIQQITLGSRNPKFLAIFRFLLESGADPSALPSTGSPIWRHCYYFGLDIITELIKHGLNLGQRNEDGETILHYFAIKCRERNSLEEGLAIIKLAINRGARLMAQDAIGFTPILLAAYWSSLAVFDYLLEKDEIDCKEKIDSLEVAAAEIVLWGSFYGSNSEPERAFEYLRKALDLRQISQLHMAPFILKSGRTIRWTTAVELEQIIEQPADHLPLCYLIQLRICSSRSWKAVYTCLSSDCIRHLKEQNRFIDLIDVLWATLETIQFHQTDSDPKYDLWDMTDDVVENLTWTLSQLEKDDPFFNAETFKDILKIILAIDLAYPRSTKPRYDSRTYTLLKLVTFLAGLPEEILDEESQEEPKNIMELLRQLVYQDRHDDNSKETLLHMTCYAENLNLATIHLLLDAGAVPNARDKNGNGPLHVLAFTHKYGSGEVIESAARLLLKYGAHLHMVNKEKETPADVWMKANKKKGEVLPELGALAEIEVIPAMEAEAPPDNEDILVPEAAVLPVVEVSLPEWLREFEKIPMLTCLCARVIRPFLFAYKKGEDFPATLGDFIEWH